MRCPKSQKEACERLSQPRKPKKEEIWEDGESPVVVIPSMLAQCSQLDRIDEEVADVQKSRARKQVAAPYAVPVCPKVEQKVERKRRPKEDLSPEDYRKLAGLLSEEVEGEAVLKDIDSLYSQLMRVSPEEVYEPVVEEPVAPEVEEEVTADVELSAPAGEELLAEIDRLYCKMMHQEPVAEAPEAEESQSVTPEASEPDLEELQKLLEELLWSVLLIARRGNSAGIMELLPFSELRACAPLLPSSLHQRLSEVPQLQAILGCRHPNPELQRDPATLVKLRRARDAILDFAAQTAQPKAAKKVRKTGLSHWTEDSLQALQAPRR